MPRESPPHPEWTAMYCFPSTKNEVGGAKIPDVVGNSQSSLPVNASNAWIFRSLVPPLNTSPPAVASMAPQCLHSMPELHRNDRRQAWQRMCCLTFPCNLCRAHTQLQRP